MAGRLHFRTIRQRRRRARSGQVSAIATILTLLLIVSYLADYLATTLPQQMQEVEFDHLLQVEDQFSQLRSTILAEANGLRYPVGLPSPITLGSGSEPPFGTPALGSIAAETPVIGQTINYSLETLIPAVPNWGVYSSCLASGAGTCSTASKTDYANYSGNGSSYTVTISGTGNSLIYNINGDNDTLTITWSGGNAGVLAVVVNGSYDTVKLTKSGTDTTVPSMTTDFFGIHDTYSLSLAGSHESAGGLKIGVAFIGSEADECPYSNNSATDKIGTLTAGGTNLRLSITWWNAVGYATDPHTTNYPGGGTNNETITWENSTGTTTCPYLQIAATSYQATYSGGLVAALENRYQPADLVGLEDGAVLVSTPNVPALMVVPPEFSFYTNASGFQANLTLVAISGPVGTASGVGTVVIDSALASVTTVVYGGGTNGLYLANPYYLNLTTEFPGAWASYLSNETQAFPYGVTCTVIGAPLPSGSSCLTPPTGWYEQISAPLYAQTVTVTTIVIDASVN